MLTMHHQLSSSIRILYKQYTGFEIKDNELEYLIDSLPNEYDLNIFKKVVNEMKAFYKD